MATEACRSPAGCLSALTEIFRIYVISCLVLIYPIFTLYADLQIEVQECKKIPFSHDQFQNIEDTSSSRDSASLADMS